MCQGWSHGRRSTRHPSAHPRLASQKGVLFPAIIIGTGGEPGATGRYAISTPVRGVLRSPDTPSATQLSPGWAPRGWLKNSSVEAKGVSEQERATGAPGNEHDIAQISEDRQRDHCMSGMSGVHGRRRLRSNGTITNAKEVNTNAI